MPGEACPGHVEKPFGKWKFQHDLPFVVGHFEDRIQQTAVGAFDLQQFADHGQRDFPCAIGIPQFFAFGIGDQLVETIRTHLNFSESGARRRAIDLLAEVGIPAPDKRIDAYPHEFSGGMRQRVVIALAICAEPELIIADEPTTALDVTVQAQIISLIKRLGRDHGTAVMLVTHDMGVIAETSDRVAVMYSGRVAEIGPVQDVVRNPLHPYAKGLMGAIPTLASDATRLVQIPGSMPRLSAIPPGCSFNPRCAFAFDRCRVERPEPIRHGAQAVACHLYGAAAKETAA